MKARDNDLENIKLILNCLENCSAKEITTFFLTHTNFLNYYLDETPIINLLLQLRYEDEKLPDLLKALHTAGVNLFACNKTKKYSGISIFSILGKDNGSNALHELIRLIRKDGGIFNPSIRDSLKFLIEQGLKINEPDEKGFTPLAAAICHFDKINIELVTFLLQQTPPPSYFYGKNKNDHVMTTLVDSYISLHLTGYEDTKGEIRFCEKEQALLETMRLLIDHGVDLNYSVNPSFFGISNQGRISLRETMLHLNAKKSGLAALVEYFDSIIRNPNDKAGCTIV